MPLKESDEAYCKAVTSWEGIREWLNAKPGDIVVWAGDVKCYRGLMAMPVTDDKVIFIREAAAGILVIATDTLHCVKEGAFVLIHPRMLKEACKFRVPFGWTGPVKNYQSPEEWARLEAKQAKEYDGTRGIWGRDILMRLDFWGPVNWKGNWLTCHYGNLYDEETEKQLTTDGR